MVWYFSHIPVGISGENMKILSVTLLHHLILFLTLIQPSSPWFNLSECVVNDAIFLLKSFQRVTIAYRIKLELLLAMQPICLSRLQGGVCLPHTQTVVSTLMRGETPGRLARAVFPTSISKASKKAQKLSLKSCVLLVLLL